MEEIRSAAQSQDYPADAPGIQVIRLDDSTQPIPVPGSAAETLVVEGAARERSRRGRIGLIGAALAGGALVAYLGAAWLESDRVARGTTVAGVAVGGLDRAEVVSVLDRAYRDLDGKVILSASTKARDIRLSAETGRVVDIGLSGGGEPAKDPWGSGVAGPSERAELSADARISQDVTLAALGLTLDAEAVAGGLTGFTLNPVSLWQKMAGGGARDADPGLSDATVGRGLEAIRKRTAVAPTNATVVFDGTTPFVEKSSDGSGIADDTAAVVRAHWLTGRVELPMVSRSPQVGTVQAQKALADQAGTAVSGPLVVRVGGTDIELTPEQFAPSLSFRPEGSGLALVVDGRKLRRVVLAEGEGIGQKPVDARIVVRNGKPSVIPGQDGITVAVGDLAGQTRVSLLATRAAQRVANVPSTAQKPGLTTQGAQKLGVRERISTFSTHLTADAGRTDNLRIAARTVDGTLVLPGETFSLNETLGERTPEKGYHPAPAISGGRLVRDYGGGVSQMATTIFNNVFFSGLEGVHHKPHSFYISRYPEGREATVNWPTVDLKWRNDSNTAVLMKASVGEQVTVSFYGTRHWDITAGRSRRSNYRTPKTVYDDSAGCVAQGANPGFDVSVSRTFRRPGSATVERTETFHAVYIAEDHVVCGPKPFPSPSPQASPKPLPGVERGHNRFVDRPEQR